MVKLSDHLHLNSQEEIAAQIFDDETVIMRLSDGAYFNMNTVGGVVWEMVEDDRTLEEVIGGVVRRYDVSSEQAQSDVQALVEQLIQAKLVTSSNHSEPAAKTENVDATEELPYEPPVLQAHHDMGDLLALDPPFGTDCKCRGGNDG